MDDLEAPLLTTDPSKRLSPQEIKSSRVSSVTSSISEVDDDDERETMLAALHAHSRAMFGIAATNVADASTRVAEMSSTSSVSLRHASPDQEEEDTCHSLDGWQTGEAFVSNGEDKAFVHSPNNIRLSAVLFFLV
ncbi:MAG: hypothetical protein TREMPRED_005877, partial [Tremellales sp. Tagirdzhanova-0007]